MSNLTKEKTLSLSFALPLFEGGVSAGFPSPADDYLEKTLDLNEHLIKHPAATFFVRVQGNSMIGAGINNNDLLIVDRSLEAVPGKVIVAVVNGEFTVKRLIIREQKVYLYPENTAYSPLLITADIEFQVWGVVTFVIHKT